MNASQIRSMMVNDGPHNKFHPENIAEQIAVAQLEMSNEIAAQLAEANQLARLRLKLEVEQIESQIWWAETTERQLLRKELEEL